ncbi:MAG: hypothetical protein CMJ48_01845 [Planctomycetaceae bacterium]|nr:hypothetical protein [Planctomycetaceae bacterium]
MSATAPSVDIRPHGSAFGRLEAALEQIGSNRSAGGDWQCPAHEDQNPSLSIKMADDRALLCCHAGCTSEDVIAALGLRMGDLFDTPQARQSHTPTPTLVSRPMRRVADYEYTDRHGEIISTKTRFEPAPNPDGEKSFLWDNGNPKVLYRLPEIVEAEEVWVNEGEKAADRMATVLPPDHAATCAPAKWDELFVECLHGRGVHVIVDRDKSGLNQARKVYDSLTAAGITVDLVYPAVTAEKADAFDHFEAGFGLDDFVAMSSPECDAETDSGDENPSRALSFIPAWSIKESQGLAAPYWIKGVVDGSATGYVYAAWGIGKTFFMLEAGSAVADGREFCGRRTTQGLVFYSCGEGQVGLRRRIRALRVAGKLTSDNLFLRDRAVDMRNPDNVDAMIADIRTVDESSDLPVAIVILDTQRRHMGDGEENPGPDTAALFDGACRVRDAFPGASVIIVNHEGYTAGRQRGHSNQGSDADFLVRLTREKGESVGRWSVEKSKDGEGLSGGYRLSVVELGVDDVDGEPLTSMVMDPVEVDDEAVAKPLTKHERIVRDGLRALLSVARGTDLEGPDSVDRGTLIDWAERNGGVTREQRRGVVFKGLKRLKARGVVEVQGQKIFLVGELPWERGHSIKNLLPIPCSYMR